MNETLKDLKQKRLAVMSSFNDLYDDVRLEVYRDTIRQLKTKIQVLESNLEEYKLLYDYEVEQAKIWKKQAEFMAKVKTIIVK